jgi:hypothetical protein
MAAYCLSTTSKEESTKRRRSVWSRTSAQPGRHVWHGWCLERVPSCSPWSDVVKRFSFVIDGQNPLRS